MEYNLKLQVILIYHIDIFAHAGFPEFSAPGMFMWVAFERTKEQTFINTHLKDEIPIPEISFCLN